VGREREGVRWGGEGGEGRREGDGHPPNVRDALTPLEIIGKGRDLLDGNHHPVGFRCEATVAM